MVSSQIQIIRFGKNAQENAYRFNQKKLLESVTMLYNKIYIDKSEGSIFGGTGSVYGLGHPEFFIKPPPPDFLEGLSVDDFSDTFGTFFCCFF